MMSEEQRIGNKSELGFFSDPIDVMATLFGIRNDLCGGALLFGNNMSGCRFEFFLLNGL
jgi:hypothetical protein